ncbi:putative tricarboxylic transport membrane protein [Aliiruegeria haliotis]|uniref:Putative tricarboxylic transport membrane protein n=1 Tax=Aliiruegeria haliotis TaxID=1280846 RepID=A0A2T0RZ17_9RHOB|nr:tripartite tricarboxylate transporter TctB family protein [Aliiruegeria haliotis]PRY26414.1 putative tricarboxylic transport membrane protein [Aliiruegeria haliotis]
MRFDSATADRVTAAVFFALGAAMAWGGYVMDRLEIRQIHPASIPGLVPMILGGALMICAALLAINAPRTPRDPDEVESGSWGNFLFTLLWSCFYALVMVGRLEFAIATAIFITGFAGWFLVPAATDTPSRLKAAGFVAVFGIVAAVAISALFRYGFLVRLP